MPDPHEAGPSLATDLVTFLFTDIEGSSALWEQDSSLMSQALAAHDALARNAVESHEGRVVKTTGDGMHAVFDDALCALAATLELQRSLSDPASTRDVPLRVRCGVHAGMVERRDNDYFGRAVNRAARIMRVAHGGQVLLSQAVVDSVHKMLPEGISLLDLGKVRLKDLSTPEHVYQVIHPRLRATFPALHPLEATPNNLPSQATSFIGRDKELQALKQLLSRSRLLTLTGSGGCGKTRLGLQVAADTLERYPDGVWFVELAALSDQTLLPKTVAVALGLEEASKAVMQMLTEHLKGRRLLLLLDNCEHLLDACAKLADALLRHSSHLTILATSREPLGIAGEQAYRVPSLSLPNAKEEQTPASVAPFEAVQLFAERALLVRPDFRLTLQNASTVASICRRLDGIPLAIELAAARVRFLSVDEINRKLDQRFTLLTGGSRTALPRQQTLRSLIDWSYDLLREPEKLLLQRLSVFAGGWTLEATEQVCTDKTVAQNEVLDLLTSLADKSLVAVEHSDAASRYRLLETVRQFARERLLESGGGETLRSRHREYFVALAEEAEPRLLGAEPSESLRRLENEHDNLRSALEWTLLEPDCGAGLRLCGALYRFWWTRGYIAEGRDWCTRVLSKAETEGQTHERAKALHVAGALAWSQNDYPSSRTLHEQSLAMSRQLREQKGIAGSLNALGLLACDQGDFTVARELYEESLAIKRELGDRQGIANSLNNLGNVAYDQGDLTAARALYEESLAIAREIGDREGVARLLGNLGNVARHRCEFVHARELHEQSLAIKRELGHRQRIAGSLNSLGSLALDQGDFVSAGPLYQEGLSIGREVGDRLGIATSLEGLAAVVAGLGNPRRAARLWGAASRVRAEVGLPLSPKDRITFDLRVAEARSALGDDGVFDRAWREGYALSLEQAVQIASNATECPT